MGTGDWLSRDGKNTFAVPKTKYIPRLFDVGRGGTTFFEPEWGRSEN